MSNPITISAELHARAVRHLEDAAKGLTLLANKVRQDNTRFREADDLEAAVLEMRLTATELTDAARKPTHGQSTT